MDEQAWLAERFEENRALLRAVAYRMLGWLTTVLARVCLDMLRSRMSLREESLGAHASRSNRARRGRDRPADRVGHAILLVDPLTMRAMCFRCDRSWFASHRA
jgi:RNA polymerase sigma-70 factor (ECF subfamily)